jgi:beta-alanine--pyruvate transaminase
MVVAARGLLHRRRGRKIFDGLSGLWCSGLGHGRARSPKRGPAGRALDYAPAFQFGHPLSFELANRIKQLTPAGLDYVFFTGSARRRPTPR